MVAPRQQSYVAVVPGVSHRLLEPQARVGAECGVMLVWSIRIAVFVVWCAAVLCRLDLQIGCSTIVWKDVR